MSDQRLSKQTVSTRKSTTAARTRAVSEDRVQTDADRLEEFRSMNAQSSLPDLPEIPGYHPCWLTSTNPRDSLQQRMRLGYEMIKAGEIAGFDYAVGKDGALDGLIHINEMVAAKISNERYQLYMLEAHHYAPAREADRLTSQADEIAASLKAKGSHVTFGDGVEALRDMDSIAEPVF